MSRQETLTVAQYRREAGLPVRPGDETFLVDAAAARREMKPARQHAEDDLQRDVCRWLDYALIPTARFFSVPNGGQRGKREAARMKGMGVKAGVPDLVFVWSDRIDRFEDKQPLVAFLELKTRVGRLSAEQRAWADWCSEQGIPHAVARTLDEAMAFVQGLGLTREGKR